jgi:predicted regulator of Ras-like GTPase activity (Roadblock/LC7/MglB family)
LINIVIILAMALLLLPIAGVVGALFGSKPVSKNSVAVLLDVSGVDLQERLSKITLSSSSPFNEELSAPPVLDPEDDADPIDAYQRGNVEARPEAQGVRSGFGASTGRSTFQGPSTSSEPYPARPALPGTGAGSVRSAEGPGPGFAKSDEGLSPLAARFTGHDSGSEAWPAQLPGTGSARQSISEAVNADPVIPKTSSPSLNSPLGGTGSSLGARLGLPGTVAQGFTVMPEAANIAARAEAPSLQRPGLPGEVSPRNTAEDSSAQSLDIRAILRGESVPRGLPGSIADFEASAASPTPKPTFTTGPLTPPAEMGMPLGGMPFDPKMLHMRAPNNDVSDPWLNNAHDGIIELSGEGDTTAALDDDTISQRVPGLMADFDASRVVEDFSLHGEHFETRVFSTSELGDAEQLGIPAYESFGQPQIGEDTSPLADTVFMSPLMETRAQDLIRDLVGLADVVSVKLVSAQGVALVTAGNENGDFSFDQNIAAMAAAAAEEVRGQGFGEVSSVALELERAALLVSSVHDGTVLTVSLSNSARLGLLRRQVRKPVAGLRSLLMESRVS